MSTYIDSSYSLKYTQYFIFLCLRLGMAVHLAAVGGTIWNWFLQALISAAILNCLPEV